jgi:hypothetical protein
MLKVLKLIVIIVEVMDANLKREGLLIQYNQMIANSMVD